MTRDMPLWPLVSSIPGSVWPAVPSAAAATVLALLQQLERSQWMSPEQLQAQQLRQLDALLRHAYTTVPWYQRRWSGIYAPAAPIAAANFGQLPLLTRRELQNGFTELRSSAVPPSHGNAQERLTSGSTGAPVRVLATALTSLYWNAFTLRDHLWHRRDLSKKLAVIRRESDRSSATNWGPATAGVVATGPAVAHSIRTDAGELLDWLVAEQPGCLFTYPSLVTALAKLSLVRGVRLTNLVEVRTLAESLGSEVRTLCRQAWDAPITDVYSASETGYIALQCPEHEHYHVQAEGVLLEVLDDAGAPCEPGQIGRVVVTVLHNFATPLVRYDIGDFAEVGEPCPCGRGLPVLQRILGRVRNTLVTADGKRYWPAFGTQTLMRIAPILQHQFVQKTFDVIEARLVVAAALSNEQEAQIRERVLGQLPPGMRLNITYHDRLERTAGGKFEDFVSEVGTA
jgi:phenylacetate-CoA ligase